MPDSDEIADYCRQIESYLCQQNQGHLIRVVGPSFELVAGWAAEGVPLKVAFRGIDRTVERHARKGPRRRPIKIDFCDADVRDVFDDWRRATGISMADVQGPGDAPRAVKRGPSLPDHLERALLRLTNARVTGVLDERADPLIDRVSQELDYVRSEARGLRGSERQAVLARLEAADDGLLALARDTTAPELLETIRAEVDRELSRFRSEMPGPAYARAELAALNQAIRERLHLPTLAFPAA